MSAVDRAQLGHDRDDSLDKLQHTLPRASEMDRRPILLQKHAGPSDTVTLVAHRHVRRSGSGRLVVRRTRPRPRRQTLSGRHHDANRGDAVRQPAGHVQTNLPRLRIRRGQQSEERGLGNQGDGVRLPAAGVQSQARAGRYRQARQEHVEHTDPDHTT